MYTRAQSRVLWRTSWLALIPAVQAIRKRNYKCAAVNLAVATTSVNHWRNPRMNSRRRLLDLIVVRLAVFLHMLEARRLKQETFYNKVVVLSLILYNYSGYLHFKKQVWPSVFLHALMHCVGFVGNCLLY